MVSAERIGKRLRKMRGETPRREVAKKCKIATTTLSMYENGKRVPRDEIKVRLAAYFKRSVEEIFFANKVTK